MSRAALLAVATLAVALTGCDRMPGYPKDAPAARPEQLTDFHALYAANCQACHGANGQSGPALDLANPEYQALVDDATLRKWISTGMPGTEMPAFAQSAGGMLTDQQIDAIIAGMRGEWSKPNPFAGATPPPYAQNGPGNAQAGNAHRGQLAYEARCASCHQQPGRQQVTSPVYLSLVSDQALRTIIIAGRPDIHQPDWMHEGPLAAQDVTDIVTYLDSLRNSAAVSAAPTSHSAP
jgi:mono/diheme cytochrome c family protein